MSSSAPTRRRAGILLAAYGLILAAIAFWPTPVDGGMGPLLRAITQHVPFLTYGRIEFAANVLLFVPLGVLLSLVVSRSLVLPTVIVATVTIEGVQALALAARTPDLSDVVANITGGCLGLLIVAAIHGRHRDSSANPG